MRERSKSRAAFRDETSMVTEFPHARLAGSQKDWAGCDSFPATCDSNSWAITVPKNTTDRARSSYEVERLDAETGLFEEMRGASTAARDSGVEGRLRRNRERQCEHCAILCAEFLELPRNAEGIAESGRPEH
jgi:hypothetical protein